MRRYKCDLLNYLLVLGKQHLWTYRRDKFPSFLSSSIETVTRKCKSEHMIAVKRNNLKMFQAKLKFCYKIVLQT